jgi:hypothetical protein
MWGEAGRRYVERFERGRVIEPFVLKLQQIGGSTRATAAQ